MAWSLCGRVRRYVKGAFSKRSAGQHALPRGMRAHLSELVLALLWVGAQRLCDLIDKDALSSLLVVGLSATAERGTRGG